MIINNITGGNSLHSNCQPDQSSSMLTNIHDFISECRGQRNPTVMDVQIDNPSLFGDERNFNTTDVPDENFYTYNMRGSSTTPQSLNSGPGNENLLNFRDEEDENMMIDFDPEFERIDDFDFGEVSERARAELISRESVSHASSRICQKIFKFTKCEECKANFDLMDEASALQSVERVLKSLYTIIPEICHQNLLKKQLMQRISSIQILFIGCEEHNDEIIQKIKTLCASQAIQTFANNINGILSGKVAKLPDKPTIIQKVAYADRTKKKRIGKYSDIHSET